MDTGDYCSQTSATVIPNVPVIPTHKDALDYNMCHKNRGICLIIEQENFCQNKGSSTRHLSKRLGSGIDSKQLMQTFDTLGFDCILRKDMKLAELYLVLSQIAQLNHTDNDCFVCVVLTHGDHGMLYAKDAAYPIDRLFKHFLGENCPTLIGKPKLFFIQACQGNRLDPGILVQSRYKDTVDSANEYYKIPTHADFMIAYSSIPGFYSFRNTEKGCWFIRALNQTIQEYYQHYDLLTMMTIVCQRVAYHYSSQAACAELSHMKQVPCITSMLTRRIFFFPKSIRI